MANGINIFVNNLSWSIQRDHQTILFPQNFRVEAGKILGVVGPNGSGKSTLLRLLYRFYKPSTGVIKIDDVDIWSLSARQVARSIATVLQEQPSDFSLTVKEVVSLGRTPYSNFFGGSSGDYNDRIVQASLDQLSLSNFSNRYLKTLSGGERQRVMVARALAQEPSLLILDEPTNHLDIRQQLEIINLLKKLPITIITSLHDLNMAANICDDILILKNGHPLGFGKPNIILSEKNISKAFTIKACHEVLIPSNSNQITFHLN